MHAIVLNTIKYSDKDLIVELLTEKDGCLSFMQRISTSKRAKIRTAWFQPLARLDVDYDDRPTHKLKRLATAQPLPLLTIPYEPAKTTMALFLAEFLRVTMRSEPASPLLFDYVWNSIEWLDTCRESFANFHLVFLLHLARFFGFEPNLEAPSPNCYFDLERNIHNGAPAASQRAIARRGATATYVDAYESGYDAPLQTFGRTTLAVAPLHE